jgi:hypothetical protein
MVISLKVNSCADGKEIPSFVSENLAVWPHIGLP